MNTAESIKTIKESLQSVVNEINSTKELFEIDESSEIADNPYESEASNCITNGNLCLSFPRIRFSGKKTCDKKNFCNTILAQQLEIYTEKIKITNNKDEVIDLLIKTQLEVIKLAEAVETMQTEVGYGSSAGLHTHNKVGIVGKIKATMIDLKNKLSGFKM